MVATVFLKKNLSIPPTLKIREGYGFNVVVVKDLVFAKSKRSTELLPSKEDTK
jgi:type IV secretory pathway VirB10-like protein